jgi:uncharacterized protein YbaP (TraB family)
MRTRLSILFVTAVLVHLLACAHEPTQTDPVQTGPAQEYLNENLGIQINFGSEWLLHTSRETAPLYLQDGIPANKGPNDSPLYVGVRAGTQAFARAMVEPVELDTLSFFRRFIEVFGGDLEVVSARYSAEADAVRWIYRARKGVVDVTFHETLTVLNGKAFRLGLWSNTSVFEKYVSEFDEIATRFQFEKNGQWHASFEGIDASLSSEGLEYVELTPQIVEERVANTCDGKRRGFLWRVEHAGGVLYLFGSIHLGHPDFYPLPDAAEQAFQDSQFLVLEMDASTPESQKAAAEIGTLGMLPEGQALEDVLAPDRYRHLLDSLEELGLPIASFSRTRPWLLATAISVIKFQSLGYEAEDGIEAYLVGKKGDREVLELESMQEQLELLSSLDGDLFLAYTLAMLDDFDEVSEQMVAAWYCGQEDELAVIVLKDHSEQGISIAEIMERMIYDRNETMASSIEALMDSPGNHFVAVGVAHLIGPRGIPTLLRARGFDVVRE